MGGSIHFHLLSLTKSENGFVKGEALRILRMTGFAHQKKIMQIRLRVD